MIFGESTRDTGVGTEIVQLLGDVGQAEAFVERQVGVAGRLVKRRTLGLGVAEPGTQSRIRVRWPVPPGPSPAEPRPPPSSLRASSPERPHTTISRTPRTFTAYSTAAPTELSPALSWLGTRLPRLRRLNWSPGPLLVIRFGTTLESEQVMNNCSGR